MNRALLHILYSGRVQGVGFRYTVKALAREFEVTGRIKNLPDGRVELEAEGTKDELRAFQKAIRESGLGQFIRDEQAAWPETIQNFRGFEIVK
jgi:acylphosphatase